MGNIVSTDTGEHPIFREATMEASLQSRIVQKREVCRVCFKSTSHKKAPILTVRSERTCAVEKKSSKVMCLQCKAEFIGIDVVKQGEKWVHVRPLPGPVRGKSIRMCAYYVNRGTCRDGEKCRYAHSPAELSLWSQQSPVSSSTQARTYERKTSSSRVSKATLNCEPSQPTIIAPRTNLPADCASIVQPSVPSGKDSKEREKSYSQAVSAPYHGEDYSVQGTRIGTESRNLLTSSNPPSDSEQNSLEIECGRERTYSKASSTSSDASMRSMRYSGYSSQTETSTNKPSMSGTAMALNSKCEERRVKSYSEALQQTVRNNPGDIQSNRIVTSGREAEKVKRHPKDASLLRGVSPTQGMGTPKISHPLPENELTSESVLAHQAVESGKCQTSTSTQAINGTTSPLVRNRHTSPGKQTNEHQQTSGIDRGRVRSMSQASSTYSQFEVSTDTVITYRPPPQISHHISYRFCRDIQMYGKCPYNDTCKFAHSDEELTAWEKARSRKCPVVNRNDCYRLCAYIQYMRKCPYGENCAFPHSNMELEQWNLQLETINAEVQNKLKAVFSEYQKEGIEVFKVGCSICA